MFAKHLDDAELFTCAGVQFGMLLPRDVTGSVEVVWERLEASQSTPTDQHSSFDQLFLILKGTGEVSVGGEAQMIKPSMLVFIPQATQHFVRCTSEEGLEYFISMSGEKGFQTKRRTGNSPILRYTTVGQPANPRNKSSIYPFRDCGNVFRMIGFPAPQVPGISRLREQARAH